MMKETPARPDDTSGSGKRRDVPDRALQAALVAVMLCGLVGVLLVAGGSAAPAGSIPPTATAVPESTRESAAPATPAVIEPPATSTITSPASGPAPAPTIPTPRIGACELVGAAAGVSSIEHGAELATDDHSSRTAVPVPLPPGAVLYDEESNTITLLAGRAASLAAVKEMLGPSDVLQELAPGEWYLAANLRIERSASLRIGAPEVRWLKLRSDGDDFVWIKVFGGELTFADTCATSWSVRRNGYDDDYEDGRSFVLARDGARMDVARSELSYLGYDASESYGVSWRLAGTTGEIIDNSFGHNYYGLYTNAAGRLIIRGNEVHHSVRYGIDPHTRTNRLLIENNVAHHNGKHGIILAEGCSDGIVRNNVVYENALHGIVIYQNSNNNLVEGNVAFRNGNQGINVNDASHNIVRGNTVYENREDGIGVQRTAADNLVSGNRIVANGQDGIALYSEATGNVVRDNTISDNARFGIYVKSTGNAIAGGNDIYRNDVGVKLAVDGQTAISRTANRIYDNREGDLEGD
jgi:parallel beta-helix repeat protein